MATKKQQQTTIIILTATLLIVFLFLGMMFIPTDVPVTEKVNKPQENTPVSVAKYDVTGRIFDNDGKPMANTKFSISLGPSDFETDENGFFVFKNLPAGIYSLSAYDKDGNRVGTTQFQLSSDGAFIIGSYAFNKGEVVTLKFTGEKFVAVNIKTTTVTTTTTAPPPELVDIPEDDTYTDLSWMRTLEPDYAGFGIDLQRDPDLFYHILEDEQYDMFNTYFLNGNMEVMLYQAEVLAKEGKKFWMNVNEAILNTTGIKVITDKLKSNWRDILDERANAIYAVAGDYFQGFYFDEPSFHWTDADFTRITKYIRETYKRRVFVIHASAAYMTPFNKGMNIIGYTASRDDGMVINGDNHKYVTDIGFWRYGSLRRLTGLEDSIKEYTKALSMCNPDMRKWYCPLIGTHEWKTIEEDVLDVNYEMYKFHINLEGFGGVVYYTFVPAPLSGRPNNIEPNNELLTDKDFLRNEKGEFVLDGEGNKIVNLEVNYSMAPFKDRYYEGCGAYWVIYPDENGNIRWPRVREYMFIIGHGLQDVFKGEKTHSDVLAELGAVYTPDTSLYKSEYWY